MGGAPAAGELGSSRWWFAGPEKTRKVADLGIHSTEPSSGILPMLATSSATAGVSEGTRRPHCSRRRRAHPHARSRAPGVISRHHLRLVNPDLKLDLDLTALLADGLLAPPDLVPRRHSPITNLSNNSGLDDPPWATTRTISSV